MDIMIHEGPQTLILILPESSYLYNKLQVKRELFAAQSQSCQEEIDWVLIPVLQWYVCN